MQSYGKEQFSPAICSYKLVKKKFWHDRVKAQGAKVLWLNETKQEAGLDISIHFLLKLYWGNDKRCVSMLEPVFQMIIYEYEPEGFEWQAFLIILMLPHQKFCFFEVNSPLTKSIDWWGFYPWNPKSLRQNNIYNMSILNMYQESKHKGRRFMKRFKTT